MPLMPFSMFKDRVQELIFPKNHTCRAFVIHPNTYSRYFVHLMHRIDPAPTQEEAAKGFIGLLHEHLIAASTRWSQVWVHKGMDEDFLCLLSHELPTNQFPIWSGMKEPLWPNNQQIVPPAAPVNNYTCTKCGNNRCSQTETKCWRCGEPIRP